jgi:prevent-host-death family protein
MQQMGASKFKVHALEIMNKVAETREPIEITKRGTPIVQLIPAQPSNEKSLPGQLAGTMKIKGDIVAPLGEELWEACK